MTFRYFLLNKPYGYLCQFTGEPDDLLLGDLYKFPSDVYSVGRLDKDSEGLLILTNDNKFKTRLLDPTQNKAKTYLVQVEGDITPEALRKLESGTIMISHNGKQHKVDKAVCIKVHAPAIWERIPPIRFRSAIPTSWIEITITEGKNRQVRKMTAAVGFPTLRLIRTKMDAFSLGDLNPGEVREFSPNR